MMFNNPNSYEEVKSLISEDEYKKIYGGSDRLISEQAVLSAIGEWIAHREYDYTNATEYLRNRIKAIPSAEPKWIPVSERLPQKSEYGDVLVTYIPSAGTLWTTVMIAQYSDLMGIAKPSFHIGEVGKKSFQNITAQVTAWMPLPKPYEHKHISGKDGE